MESLYVRGGKHFWKFFLKSIWKGGGEFFYKIQSPKSPKMMLILKVDCRLREQTWYAFPASYGSFCLKICTNSYTLRVLYEGRLFLNIILFFKTPEGKPLIVNCVSTISDLFGSKVKKYEHFYFFPDVFLWNKPTTLLHVYTRDRCQHREFITRRLESLEDSQFFWNTVSTKVLAMISTLEQVYFWE